MLDKQQVQLLFIYTVYLCLDAGAVLGLNVVDLTVGRLVDPDQVEVVAGVVVDVVGAKLLGEVTEGLVLPAVKVLARIILSRCQRGKRRRREKSYQMRMLPSPR